MNISAPRHFQQTSASSSFCSSRKTWATSWIATKRASNCTNKPSFKLAVCCHMPTLGELTLYRVSVAWLAMATVDPLLASLWEKQSEWVCMVVDSGGTCRLIVKRGLHIHIICKQVDLLSTPCKKDMKRTYGSLTPAQVWLSCFLPQTEI